jgi:hypothetical protein
MAAFTAVAAGVGLAVTAATTAISFAQAAEQNDKKKKAEESAAAAMMEARKKLDVNYYEQLSIQKEPYELARRELLSQGALATQQLAEGDERALAAGVGRVQLAQQMGQEKVATAMQQEQTALEKLVAGEDSRLRDLGAQLDLQEVIGAQQAMSDAERAESMAVQQGLAGVTSLATQTAALPQLYGKKPLPPDTSGLTAAIPKADDPLTVDPLQPVAPLPDANPPGYIPPTTIDPYPGGSLINPYDPVTNPFGIIFNPNPALPWE